MKKIHTIIVSLVMLSLAGFSQQADPLLPVDEKMTPEEREAVLNADYSNPAKIDGELPVEPVERGVEVKQGEWNLSQPDAKPIIQDERKEIVPAENIPALPEVSQPSTSSEQSPCDKAGIIKNRRVLKGPEAQPPGENMGVKSIDRKSLNGPGAQPEGENTKKKDK
jgi:hypothetical protein